MYFTLALDIKGTNVAFFKPKLNIKNALLVFLVIIFLIVNNANSAPPPLPPAIPKQEDNKINNKESKHENSFFDKIFGSEKSDDNASKKPVQQTVPAIDKENSNNAENVDDFINLGDKKLPILENLGAEGKGNSTSEQGNIKQQSDSMDILIPSLPPEVLDDLNPYAKSIKNDDIPVAPSLKNEVENGDNIGQIVPVLPPVLPSNRAEIPQVDDKADKKETVPATDATSSSQSTPLQIPVLPAVLPSNKVEVPQVDDKTAKKETVPSTDATSSSQSTPLQIPVLPPVLPSNKVEVLQVDDKADKKETVPATDATSSSQSIPVQIPLLPNVLPSNKVEMPQVGDKADKKETVPATDATSSSESMPPQSPLLPSISVPEVEVTKPLDKKDNNAKMLPSLPMEKVLPSMPTTGSKDNIKTDVEQSNSSSEKLLLDNVKIPTKPKDQTPVPVFVRDNKPAIEENKNDKEKSDKKIIEEQVKGKEKLPEQTVVKTLLTSVIEKNVPENEMSEELAQFINNETQMLLLPNDDIVLGDLTYDARIEQMEIYSFITEFKQYYDRDKRKNQRQQIDNFINNYSSNFRTIYIMPCNVMNMAFDTIIKNDLSSLGGLLDNYPILQKKGVGNNTLLHMAVGQNNYYIAKFLIIRGINVNQFNDEYKTALDIAREECNSNIACLIKKRKAIVK